MPQKTMTTKRSRNSLSIRRNDFKTFAKKWKLKANRADNSLVYLSKSDDDTEKFGEDLAVYLTLADVLAISGELGAGKTTLIRGICRRYGIDDVNSPSFAIVNHYFGDDSKVYHIDFYRIASIQELMERGIYDYLGVSDAITIVEWADLFPQFLPDSKKIFWQIEIERIADEERKILIRQRPDDL